MNTPRNAPELDSSGAHAGNQEDDARRHTLGQFLVRHLLLIVFGISVLVIGLYSPNFLTARNLINVLKQASDLGLMAVGMSLVLITGGIDLSIPAVMALSGILGVMFMRNGGNPAASGVLMVAVGSAAGVINGYAVAYLKMIPFVVTLSMMAIVTGTSTWLTNKVSVTGIDYAFVDAVTGKIGIVPVPVILLLVVTSIAMVLVRRSFFGRWLYAVGTNARTARVSGIRTDRVIFGAYVLSGFFAGLAAIIVSARLESASVTMGPDSFVLDIVSSAVVGGVSIYGGAGSPMGAVIGAIVITLLGNSMNMMHVSYFYTLLLKGGIIILAVALDALRKK